MATVCVGAVSELAFGFGGWLRFGSLWLGVLDVGHCLVKDWLRAGLEKSKVGSG